MKQVSNRKRKVMVGLGILAFILVAGYVFAINITRITGKSISDASTNIDKCLSDKGVIFYSAENCDICAEQRRILGNHIVNVNYVDCNSDYIACANLDRVPAWEFEGKVKVGIMNVSELREFINC